MKNTTFYNAGAGAGKTYTLTHKLADLIKYGMASPDGVILTTFTDAAAAEFREKAKAVLCEYQMYDEALALDQAMIGTVHSVALNFIKKFWYILGRAEDDNVMGEEDKLRLMNISLATIATDQEVEELQNIAEDLKISGYENGKTVLNLDFWKGALREIVEKLFTYGITDMEPSIKFSKDYIDQIFSKEVVLNDTLIDDVLKLIKAQTKADDAKKSTDASKKRIEAINKYMRLKDKSLFAIYYNFNEGDFNTKAYPQLKGWTDVVNIHNNLLCSKLVGEKLKRCVDIIFGMALRWKNDYEEYKRRHHMIDYNDMEGLLEELLNKEEVQAEIRSKYTHLFVDEFQDSSPVQVRIFEQLSSLVKETYAVGDPKQAIYDFRGADTELTLSVIKDIAQKKNGNKVEPLSTSHRSVEPLVTQVNELFIPAFADTLDSKQVELHPKRGKESVDPLRWWQIDGASQIMQGILKIKKEEAVEYSDIAVLAKNNSHLDDIATLLRSNGIPVCRKAKLTDSVLLELLNACLRLAENENDNYARMCIAFYTRKMSVAQLVDSKLRLEEKEQYLSDAPLIEKVNNLRAVLELQSLSKKVETLMVEAELSNYAVACMSVGDVQEELQTILAAAQAYEQRCAQTLEATSVAGWIEHSAAQIMGSGDEEGVCLSTIHSSKGLEWKYVILINLSDSFLSNSIRHNVFGVHRHKVDGKALIHYLQMFGSGKKLPEMLQENIEKTAVHQARTKTAKEEIKRLMYVAFTRARDVLILGSNGQDMKYLDEAGIDTNKMQKDLEAAISFAPIDGLERKEETKQVVRIAKDSLGELKRRDVAPSKVATCACKVEMVTAEDGERIDVNALRHVATEDERYQILGDCIHQALCGIEYLSDEQLCALIKGWGLSHVLTATQLRKTWERLITLLKKHYGAANRCVHEGAFRYHKDGQIISGSIDLLYYLNEKDVVLVDYKTCPAGEQRILDENSSLYAGKYSGQLATYKIALEADGKRVIASLIYYPISGMLVRVDNME